jgi:hypothetical protein
MKDLHITCTSIMKKSAWKNYKKYDVLHKVRLIEDIMNKLKKGYNPSHDFAVVLKGVSV